MTPTVMPTYARAPLSFVKGEGSWLIEADGRRFLDMTGGIAVNALGHAHPDLVETLTEQAGQLWHTSNLYNIPQQERLADLLCEHTFADTVFFTNSGTEAMECAFKMARKYHHANGDEGRKRAITFNGSFHGRSLAMVSAAGGDKLVNGFGPLVDGFDRLEFGDHDALEAAMGDDVSCVILEPVQGEGGIVPVPVQCLKGLRDLCDQHGVLLVLDEIQCGMGRSGKLFSHEYAGIKPDIMAVAKGIGGGFPLGACLATEKAASGMVAGTHGSTYGGNPLACSVGAKVMEIVANGDFLDSVNEKASQLRQGLQGLIDTYPDLLELVRGQGLMLGLKCKVPNMDVINAGYDAEVLGVPGGDNVVRLLPPLNISSAEISESLARLETALKAVRAAQ